MSAARTRLEFRKRPSALAFMARALRPSPGFRDGGVPALGARWAQHRADAAELHDFLALSGLGDGEYLPLLYPHTIAFPLQMALLTHPAFPVPIWRVLQVRNHILQHMPLPKRASFDLTVRVAGHRVLDKGAEVDLHTMASSGERSFWESVNTFYVRGRFRGAQAPSARATAPAVGAAPVAEWSMPASGGWRFGALSGDYNGIHLWTWYARRFGFRQAFAHPQRVLGQCLARLPELDPARPQRFDAWLKGPVYYAAAVALRAQPQGGAIAFALNMQDEARPAIVGRIGNVAPGSRLADDDAAPIMATHEEQQENA